MTTFLGEPAAELETTMCICQPDIVMFSEFQPPLFDRYDLSVEFERRRCRAADLLAERWPRLRQQPDEDALSEILMSTAVKPLRLVHRHQRLVVEPYGDTDDGERCYYFRLFIPYDGDVELWDLSPGDTAEEEARGAVAYLEYVTGVLETSEAAAMQHLGKQVGVAERMIRLQSQPIQSFNASLHTQIARQIERRRLEETVN